MQSRLKAYILRREQEKPWYDSLRCHSCDLSKLFETVNALLNSKAIKLLKSNRIIPQHQSCLENFICLKRYNFAY